MPDAIALEAREVSKRYGPVTALDGVSLAVHRAECVALIGESGSGKTTLLRCFNRLTDPDAGTVLVDGADTAALDPVALRRRIGYVPQEGGLMPHWRVRRNVALVPWLRGQDDAAAHVDRALRLVGRAALAAGRIDHRDRARDPATPLDFDLTITHRAFHLPGATNE